MKLDYSSLERAFGQREKGFCYLHSRLAHEDPSMREQFWAATIHAVKYTCEPAIKMIQRQLAQIASNSDELHRIDLADLMRVAADTGVSREAQSYLRYREIRKKTSLTYTIEHTERTLGETDAVLQNVWILLKELARRNSAADLCQP